MLEAGDRGQQIPEVGLVGPPGAVMALNYHMRGSWRFVGNITLHSLQRALDSNRPHGRHLAGALK